MYTIEFKPSVRGAMDGHAGSATQEWLDNLIAEPAAE